MTLVFDAERDCFRGEQLIITRSAFAAALLVLVESGIDETAARLCLLNEAAWQDAQVGARTLGLDIACAWCRAPLDQQPRPYRFCDVLCEASWLVEAQSVRG